jgi:hypothetical protein
MLMPIALSDSELTIIFGAAQPLAVQDRDAFLQEVAERLSSLPHLGDGLQICREVQREHWKSAGRYRGQVWNALRAGSRLITAKAATRA